MSDQEAIRELIHQLRGKDVAPRRRTGRTRGRRLQASATVGSILEPAASDACHCPPAAVRDEFVFRGLLSVYLGTPVFTFALVNAWSVRHTGRLCPAIVFHAVHDAICVFVSVTLACAIHRSEEPR